jgi:hypothetical protein
MKSTSEDVCISVELCGLRQSRSCILYFNSREVGRIVGTNQRQEIDISLASLRTREMTFNRPWYKENLHIDVYDSEGCKKSSYSVLGSLKGALKSAPVVRTPPRSSLPLPSSLLPPPSLLPPTYSHFTPSPS